ncbi:hypothetical protein AVEN_214847-1 [Araneus ventricosus]|uniref:Uncharacterized protein n=1 Tax=Araneus ventricosus TaxID=182803 RepID=A0A4Y2M9V1_ARAVE|nr:hypothetical protein AVEN_98101-1 [Araneus ventricosus]GBN11242.1 hypothetical protein AVEN_251702-1 [Araneus ventricosus]GBN23429.1 hypothetical protein AVEN_69191-1 [Araneus ventricosus]GBN23451.1 hypothetical protein AVEN_214847-1 [Araneus ventricosus]
MRKLEEMLHTLDIGDHEVEQFKKDLSKTIRDILEGLGIFEKRSVGDFEDPMESMLGDLSFRDFFLRMKQYVSTF